MAGNTTDENENASEPANKYIEYLKYAFSTALVVYSVVICVYGIAGEYVRHLLYSLSMCVSTRNN